MNTPSVDLIIAVHNPQRTIERAVASVLTGTQAAVRVTVVCHNTPEAGISARLGEWVSDPRLRLLTVTDGVPSPAGPFNAGLAAATAPFTSVLGSDDHLESGAIDSWLALVHTTQADAIITRLRHASGSNVPTPPTRPGRRQVLNAVADRLMYRSAPLGLIRRETLGQLRFSEGLATGEDLAYVCQAWTSGHVAYDRHGPAYVIGDDATDRVTFITRGIGDEFAYLSRVLDTDWFNALSKAEQSAIVVKFVRVHVFGAVLNRSQAQWWTTGERAALQTVVRLLLARGHGIERVLSRADHKVLRAIENTGVPAAELIEAAERRRRFLTLPALLPPAWGASLHREAPLRMMAASWLAKQG